MAWPQTVDFSRSLEDPDQCFEAPDLARGTAALALDGAPLFRSGDSACVFKIVTAEGDVAVRCFTREVPGQQERYAALGEYFRGLAPDWMVGFEYLERGIRVEREWYPIVRMDWAEGDRLDRFVGDHIGEPDALLDLAARWRSTVASLRGLGIAHNDLEPGNVIVSEQGPLRLVDYDGMFIPSSRGQQSPEAGHRNYRHPIRTTGDYNENIDNFPSVAVYLALLALAADPDLWERFHGPDNLLLKREDLANPYRSACFEALRGSPDPYVVELAAWFERMCSLPVDRVPDLEGVIRALPGSPHPVRTPPPPVPSPANGPAASPVSPAAPTTAPAPPAAPVPATDTASGNVPGGLQWFLVGGKPWLGLLAVGSASFLLGFFLKPAEHVFIVVLASALCLLSFQARYATRLPVAILMAAGVGVYLWGVPRSAQYDNSWENAAALFFGVAIMLIGLSMASRLLGWTRSPEPASGASAFFDGMGSYNRLGMSLFVIGLVAFLVGLMPQEVLNALLPEGVDYFRAGGINESAAALFWPMMILDKVEFLGIMSLWLGIALLLFGAPRAILFSLILRRGRALLAADRRRELEERLKRAKMSEAARSKDFRERLARAGRGTIKDEEEPDPVEEARTIQFALGLMVFGLLAFLFASQVVEGFLLPTALEIGAAVTRDYDVLYTNWGDLPWWVRVPNAILKYLGAIAGLAGFVFFVVSLRSVRAIVRGIDTVMDKLDELFPPSPPSGESPPGTTGTAGSTTHGGAGYGATLIARARGRGGRGR